VNLSRHKPDSDYSFDLTALVDVVFLLLAFFVMGSQFAQAQRTSMDLPRQSGEHASSDSPRSLVIDLFKDGSMRIDNTQMPRESVLALLKKEIDADAQGRGRDLDVTIRVEQSAPSRLLSELARDAARAGVRKWKIATVGGGL